MRRTLWALSFVASVVPLASIASAQEAQPDAGAPTATVTATVTPTVVAPPPATTTTTQSSMDQEPLRLGRMIEIEADRARARRYGGSTVQMVIGAGAVVTSSLVFTLDFSGVDPAFKTLIDILGVFGIVTGSLTIIDGVISLFGASPMERLFDRYAPIAIDTSLSPAERVRRGEGMLESMAAAEKSIRTIGGVEGLILGGLEAGLAIFFAADNDLWVGDPNADVNRALFATAFGLGAVSALGEAIGKLAWERGPAEVAWEHWHASHETVTVQTAKVRFEPTFGPTRGGAAVGFALRF